MTSPAKTIICPDVNIHCPAKVARYGGGVMGAEIPIWVEVSVTKKVWRKSYGVVPREAIDNLDLNPYEYVTGNYSYTDPALEGEDD